MDILAAAPTLIFLKQFI